MISTIGCLLIAKLPMNIGHTSPFSVMFRISTIIIHEDSYLVPSIRLLLNIFQIYAIFLGIIITFATIKFLKLLRFNKRMGMLTATLRHAWPNLWQFMIFFAIMFFAFTQLAYCMFHTTLYDFQSFITAAETLFSVMLGNMFFIIKLMSIALSLSTYICYFG